MKSKPYREILKIIENNPQSVQSKNSLTTDICSDRIQNWKLNKGNILEVNYISYS